MHGWAGGLIAVAALAVALSAAEWIDPEDRAPKIRFRLPVRTDAGWFVVYLAYAPVTAVLVMAGVHALSRRGVARSLIDHWPAGVALVGAFVVADACAYALHRLMHARPSLWRFHVVHHDASDVRWWTTFRFHPVDGVLQHAVPLLVAAACGFGPVALSGYVAVVFVVTVFAHADIWVPNAVARLVAVPAFHRTHHEVGHEHVNYALVLPLWDWMFGTSDFNSRAGAREFPQRKSARPMANEVMLATPLMTSAARGSESRPRHTNAASR